MPRCPYAPHRLALDEQLRCKHCGGDLWLYGVLSELPVCYFNQAHRLWDTDKFDEAAGWLYAALKLRKDFAEAYWLLGAIETKLGRPESAGRCLTRAQQLGAAIDPSWITALLGCGGENLT